MRFGVGRITVRGLRSPLAVCAAGLVLGCSGLDRELLEDLLDGRGHGHSGGGHGHGGHGGGGPVGTDCGFISSDQVLSRVAADLATLDADDQAFVRYLTLANQANADGCGAALDGSRAALDKLVNSLSLNTTLSRLVPVDANLTLYRLDMRDYDWDREIEVGGTLFADGWEAIVASSVYAVPFVGDDADAASARAGTRVPVLFGDAFVAAAATAPLYYGLLGIPEDVDAFMRDELGVDVDASRADGAVVRAGLAGTGVGAFEFLAERFDLQTRSGYVWQLFSDENGAAALLEDPLSTPASEEREITFTLPNGLLAHVLAGADGSRLDESDLTLDTGEDDFRAKVARSFMKFRSQGVLPEDALRPLALEDAARFEPDELARILATYPSAPDLELVVLGDRLLFENALGRIDLDIDAPDPVDAAFLEFDRDVDAATAAGDLYVTTEELLDNLNLLAPQMSVLNRGTLDRGDFGALYRESLCILGVVNENAVDPSLCP